jgi:hypothetical protein
VKRAAVLVLSFLGVLAVAGCSSAPVEQAATPIPRDQGKPPPPRPVRWQVTPTQPLELKTRIYTLELPGYDHAVALEIASDADGDGHPDVEINATRSSGALGRLLLLSHRPLGAAEAVTKAPQRALTYRGDLTSGSLAKLQTDEAVTRYPCGESDCATTYTAMRVTVPGLIDLGGDWTSLPPRPPQYPKGTVWDLGDWNGDHRTDFLAATIAGTNVLAPTDEGMRVLPLDQLETPAGQSLAFPVALDLDGDGRSEVVGFGSGGAKLQLVIVAPPA